MMNLEQKIKTIQKISKELLDEMTGTDRKKLTTICISEEPFAANSIFVIEEHKDTVEVTIWISLDLLISIEGDENFIKKKFRIVFENAKQNKNIPITFIPINYSPN